MRQLACRAMPLFLALAAVPLALSPARSAESAPEAPARIRPAKIILVGDSTTAVVGGWGPSFCAYHVTSFAACLNLARGGRSSGSYRAEGSWDVVQSEMRTQGYADTWVLIQFGHNDQPGKPGRSTDLATEFPRNIARYVDEVRAAGAHPVLLTPLTRRSFVKGRLEHDLEPWSEAIRKVAREKQVPLVDLNALSSAAVQQMGEEAADRFAQLPKGAAPVESPPASTEVNDRPMGRTRLSFDRTHLGREGADYFATMVTAGLAQAVPDMRSVLIP